MTMTEQFSPAPGDLIAARGREWVVVGNRPWLTVRPLVGSESEIEALVPELEVEPVCRAHFKSPDGKHIGGRTAAQLLRDALRLSLRRGAGPFRGAGRINFQPRTYQLAPLILALRMNPVRLLIADDVGVGKTIETGLILREMLDRGEIRRCTVLCPPILVDQWVQELDEKFSIPAVPVTASNTARLERRLPPGQSVFHEHHFTVVSIDFIKNKPRSKEFIRACPNTVVVDEAHTAVGSSGGRSLRYELVQSLAEKQDRHMILLTATPHSGKKKAFRRLLGLLGADFGTLFETEGGKRQRMRSNLARHFIQRRRSDIKAWRKGEALFPRHERAEVTYHLAGRQEEFYLDALDYCSGEDDTADQVTQQQSVQRHMLSMMRCVGSSPAAAAAALRNKWVDAVGGGDPSSDRSGWESESLLGDDFEPSLGGDSLELRALLQEARSLTKNYRDDRKYQALVGALLTLVEGEFSPVVFCHFEATARWVAQGLHHAFPRHAVKFVTGQLPRSQREERVESLRRSPRRILVSTDCLAEGINLQEGFDAVVHYDLCWNPTKHQQREGRVDRFGQKNERVRSVTLYGDNNPMDRALVDVILRKADAIKKETGVHVPCPDETGFDTEKLLTRVLQSARKNWQRLLGLDFGATNEARELTLDWEDAAKEARLSKTIFAQNPLKSADVSKEWNLVQSALGGERDTERFVRMAMERLKAPLEPIQGNAFLAQPYLAPRRVRERFASEGLMESGSNRPIRIGFAARPPKGCIKVHRVHSLPAVLAETFLEQAMDPVLSVSQGRDLATLPRCGAWASEGVEEVTWLLLLRLRHRLQSRAKYAPPLPMAEESAAIAISKLTRERLTTGLEAYQLLDSPSYDLPKRIRDREVMEVVDALPSLQPELKDYAAKRAAVLAEDHIRVRAALGSEARVKVEAVWPVDVIGLYALLPTL